MCIRDSSCTIGKLSAHTGLLAYADTTVHGDCTIVNGDIVISGSRNDENNLVGGSIEACGNLIFSGTKKIVEKTTSDGLLTYTEEALCPSAIYGKKYYVDGDGKLVSRGPVEILVPQDENGDLLIGRGVSSTLSTTDCTRIYGYDVYLYSHAADLSSEYGAEYRPYYRLNDSIVLRWFGSGYITSNSTQVCFSIPLAKPVIGEPKVQVNSVYGLCVRQSGYCYGATASDSYVVPSSYSAELDGDGTSVRIVANMPNTTNTTNNAPCGIDASIQIMFS